MSNLVNDVGRLGLTVEKLQELPEDAIKEIR